MLHVISLLAAGGVPNVTPDTNNPASDFINRLLALFLGVLVMVCVFLFFAGGIRIVSSIGSHHDGGARSGAYTMIASAVFLAFLFIGTPLVNDWANFFHG